MNLIGSKTIKTNRLILRPTEESDLKPLWEILSIEEVNKYYLTCKINKNWEDEIPWQMKKLSHALDNDVFQWSIILKKNNECIGQISVQEKDNVVDKSIRDIGWFINPKYQRKGYAYETAKAILDYMFNEVNIKEINTGAAINNPASWKLMEKLGFTRISDKTHIIHYTFGGDVEAYSYDINKNDYNKELHIVDIIELNDYKKLIKDADWKVLSDKQHLGSLNNSMHISVLKLNGEVIGMARLVGDGFVHGLLCDVVVLKKYQNHHYGTIVVQDIIKKVQMNLEKDEQFLIELCPAYGKRNFYLNCGFKYKPENMDGMYLWAKN